MLVFGTLKQQVFNIIAQIVILWLKMPNYFVRYCSIATFQISY